MKGLVKGQVEANLLSGASSRLQPFESEGNERNSWGRIIAFHWTVSPLFSSTSLNQINLWFVYRENWVLADNVGSRTQPHSKGGIWVSLHLYCPSPTRDSREVIPRNWIHTTFQKPTFYLVHADYLWSNENPINWILIQWITLECWASTGWSDLRSRHQLKPEWESLILIYKANM